jgi:hypothetical protein
MRLIENLSILSIGDYLTQPRNWDIFITCSSFEERCKRSSDIFLGKNVEIATSIIFNYKETDPKNKKEENMREMKSNLEKVCNYVHILNTESVSLPSEGIKKFLMFLKEKNIDLLNKRIITDITVFTKGYFFLLFKVLKEKFNLHELYVIYTEPEKYKGKGADGNEIILTEGLDRVASNPGFTGSSRNDKDALIVILGFEGKRSMEVFNSVEPDMTYAVNGFPSFQPGWHKISLEANLPFLQESGASDHLFFAPAVDPFETRNTVSRIVEEIEKKNKDINIIISPLGTKLQAFGVLLYALGNKKIKVIYPFPSVYKPDYSYKYGPTWIFKVNLNGLIRD